MSVTMLPLDILVQRCIDENSKFARREVADDAYMFELLRRALVLDNSDALEHVQRLFERRLVGWVYKHGSFPQTGESAEYFSNKAFSEFCVAMRKNKLAGFETFAKLMEYLKRCVNSAIMEYARKDRGSTQSLESIAEQSHTPDLSERAIGQELLQHIFELLPDPQDRLLVRYKFIYGLPPREIMRQPDVRWSTERDITLQLYRIRKILRDDPELRERFGL